MMFRRLGPCVLCLACVLISACAEPPTRELNEAQSAIDEARAAGAEEYAKGEYTAAVVALKLAQQAVSAQDYRSALNSALDSREQAQAAAKAAADQKALARSQAERAMGEVSVLLNRAKARLAAAESARTPRRALTGPIATTAAADAAVQKAGAAITQGNYREAQELLADTADRLRAGITELDAADDVHVGRPRP